MFYKGMWDIVISIWVCDIVEILKFYITGHLPKLQIDLMLEEL